MKEKQRWVLKFVDSSKIKEECTNILNSRGGRIYREEDVFLVVSRDFYSLWSNHSMVLVYGSYYRTSFSI
jgi:hypothetical protein